MPTFMKTPDLSTGPLEYTALDLRNDIERTAIVNATFPLPGQPIDDRPLNEKVLDALVDTRLSEQQITEFDARTILFFDMRADSPATFQQDARDKVQESPNLALAATLAGAKLDATMKAQAARDLEVRLDRFVEGVDEAVELVMKMFDQTEKN